MEYLSTKTIGEKWNISDRRVRVLCRSGRIPGVVEEKASYLIPSDAVKPVDKRYRPRTEIIATVLCYGDSNTFGYNPANGMRYPKGVRWTSILQDKLGDEYDVVEEGCNGRTTIFDDPVDGWKNGIDYLKPCLNSHKPVDIVILMLGSNDLKRTFNATAKDSANGIEKMLKTIIEFTELKQGFAPRIVLVAPPHIGEGIADSPFSSSFEIRAIDESRRFAGEYKKVADRCGCAFVDASEYTEPSAIDSLHLMPESHARLAGALAETVEKIVKDN